LQRLLSLDELDLGGITHINISPMLVISLEHNADEKARTISQEF
jgi:hypothetical protein